MSDTATHVWVSRNELPAWMEVKLAPAVTWLLVSRVWYFAVCKDRGE